MAIREAYTLAEARQMLDLWKACEIALATGQAKAYKIGTREFTSLDLDEIADRVRYWSDAVASLSGSVRSVRAVRVIPRDL